MAARRPPGGLHRWPHLVPAREAPGLLIPAIEQVARIVALTLFGAAGVVALTHWAVRARRLTPQGWWPRLVRNWSDPLLRPLERRIVARGGNPQDGTLWLLGLAAAAGLALVMAVRWILGMILLLQALRSASPAIWVQLLLGAAIWLVMTAILVRVIGSWLGLGRHTAWIRPAYRLTDWIVEPIRRRLPPMGLIDLSPFVAYLILLLLRGLITAPF